MAEAERAAAVEHEQTHAGLLAARSIAAMHQAAHTREVSSLQVGGFVNWQQPSGLAVWVLDPHRHSSSIIWMHDSI